MFILTSVAITLLALLGFFTLLLSYVGRRRASLIMATILIITAIIYGAINNVRVAVPLAV